MSHKQTIVIKEGAFKGQNALEFVTWKDDDGWWGCATGYDDGNLWEGADLGPFDSRQKALDELADDTE
jgi:hypothetical protein